MPLEELLTAWYELWVREREAIMHLLAPFHASFMYSQHKFGAAFQAVEALHHKPRFTGHERYHLKLWIGVLDESAAYLPA